MTEDEAQATVAHDVSRETLRLIEHYVALLQAEATRQNLIAKSTLSEIWQRHILDSLQLRALGAREGAWLDIGTGAGLPGIVVAIATGRATMLVEPRALRVAFLERVVGALGLAEVRIAKAKAQHIVGQYPTISARAVGGIGALFEMAQHLATPQTRWVLPRGRSAEAEVAEARRSWQGEFQLVPSATDSAAAIVVASHVRARKSR